MLRPFYFVAFLAVSTIAIDSNYIVKLHNDVRAKIRSGSVPGQPRGVNVGNLAWDDNLARLASVNAKSCRFAHDQPKDSRFYVGQNLYYSGWSDRRQEEKWNDAVNAWFNEYKVYTFSNQFNPRAGHYTQLVWANTKYVGCAYNYCPGSSSYQNYYVCNYGPGGNIIGQYPYKTG